MTVSAPPAGPLEASARLWIGGREVPASDAVTFPVVNPATGATIARVADARPADAALALDAAAGTQKEWEVTAPRDRGEILRRAYELLIDRTDDVAGTITSESGKPLHESRSEVIYGAEYLRWFGEEAVRIGGRHAMSPMGTGEMVVTRAAVGPVLAVTPWNFPLAMGTRKIGPALAAGCTIIVKPAEQTPLTMLLLAKILDNAGLPPGVLSVLPTTDAPALTAPLFADPRLRKLTFTGSTRVGKELIRQSADQLLRTSMELGGNAPFLVFDDADLDTAVEGAMAAKMRNGGQACTAANRFLVADRVADEFADKLQARIAALRFGPAASDADLGPLISLEQRRTVAALVDDAVTRGARVRVGGYVPDGEGFHYPPTLIDQIPQDARLLKEEIFGPVAALTTFTTDDEAIGFANATEYGLAAYLFTRDLDRARRVAAALDSGMIGINRGVISDAAAPFGGIKHSGFGREGGTEGIEEYLDTKYVAM